MKQSELHIQRIKDVFSNLRADNLHILDSFYAPNVQFIDPIGAHDGIESTKKYYAGLYKNVTYINFDYLDTISQEQSHVLVWRMDLKAGGLNSGNLIQVFGNSVIKFGVNDLVIYHRDYFDLGEMIYERVAILGRIIKMVKAKMGNP